MEVRLDRLGDEPFTWEETLALSTDDLGLPDVLAVSGVFCRGRIQPVGVNEGGEHRRAAVSFLLGISLRYEQTLSCTRCLGPIVEPVESRIDLLVEIGSGEAGGESDGEEHELAEEDFGVLALPGPVLDTGPLVIEQVQLGVPMKSLCRDDCAGICSHCGADLNDGPCGCRPEPDPRWAALASLKREVKEDG